MGNLSVFAGGLVRLDVSGNVRKPPLMRTA